MARRLKGLQMRSRRIDRHRGGAFLGLVIVAVLFALISILLMPPTFARGEQGPPGPSGHAMNPSGYPPGLRLDDRGFSYLHLGRKRTPTGILYPYPWRPEPFKETKSGWLYRGALELGYIGLSGDTQEARFQNYADRDQGVLPADFALEVRQPEKALWGEVHLQSVARDDALYRVALGRYDRFRLRAFHDSVPRVYMNDATILFTGAGSEYLSLPAGLTPGSNTGAEIDAALATSPQSSLSVDRTRTGISLELAPLAHLSLFTTYRFDERQGARPFGGSLFFGFVSPALGSLVEGASPIDYRTHDLSVGFEYTRPEVQFRFSYDYSRFDNRNESLSWENPFLPPPAVDKGRLALEPDNHLHGFRGDLGVALPAHGRFTAVLSWRDMRQDEELLAPTINDGIPDWDSSAALSQDHADARVTTLLAEGKVFFQPIHALSLRASLRVHDRDDKTDFDALNPLTGDSGFIAEDGGAGSAPVLRTGNINYDDRRIDFEAGTTWSIDYKTSLDFAYRHEEVRRERRETDETKENLLRVSLSTRRLPWATLRLAYEVGDRDGSNYEPDPNADVYLDAGGTVSIVSPGQRKYDLADRKRHAASLRSNFLLGDSTDLGLVLGFRDEDYDAAYGLDSDSGADATIELNYQPSARFDLYAYLTYEVGERRIAAVHSAGATFPDDNRWWTDSELRTFGGGAGASYRPWSRVTLALDYDFIDSREEIDYDYASLGATSSFGGGLSEEEAGEAFPAQRNQDHRVETSLRYQWTEKLATKLLYRFFEGSIDDFSQEGLELRYDKRLFLGHIDRDYSVHLFGASAELKF